jgi:hypothetical protein
MARSARSQSAGCVPWITFQNLIATLKNTAIEPALRSHLVYGLHEGIIKSGSNMCPYKCLLLSLHEQKNKGVPLATVR